MKEQALVIFNFALCMGVAWAAICRLNALAREFKVSERLKYVVMLFGASVSALRGPVFGEQAGFADLTLAGAVLIYLMLGMWRWRHGAPQDAQKIQPE